jgi:hypothetical protein
MSHGGEREVRRGRQARADGARSTIRVDQDAPAGVCGGCKDSCVKSHAMKFLRRYGIAKKVGDGISHGGQRYPAIVSSWRRRWEEVIPLIRDLQRFRPSESRSVSRPFGAHLRLAPSPARAVMRAAPNSLPYAVDIRPESPWPLYLLPS